MALSHLTGKNLHSYKCIMGPQAWDAKRDEQQSEEKRAAASFENCCSCVEQLGMQLYPNDAVFPEPHVCLRLELAAAGRWPEAGPASTDDSRVASAMLKVCSA